MGFPQILEFMIQKQSLTMYWKQYKITENRFLEGGDTKIFACGGLTLQCHPSVYVLEKYVVKLYWRFQVVEKINHFLIESEKKVSSTFLKNDWMPLKNSIIFWLNPKEEENTSVPHPSQLADLGWYRIIDWCTRDLA